MVNGCVVNFALFQVKTELKQTVSQISFVCRDAHKAASSVWGGFPKKKKKNIMSSQALFVKLHDLSSVTPRRSGCHWLSQ